MKRRSSITSYANASSPPKPWNSMKSHLRFHWETSIPLKWKLIKGKAYFKHISEPAPEESLVQVPALPKPEKVLPNPGLSKNLSVNARLKNYFRSPKKIQSCQKLRPNKREINTQLPMAHSSDYAITKYSFPNPLSCVQKSEGEETFAGSAGMQQIMQRFNKKQQPLPQCLPRRGLRGALVRKFVKPVKRPATGAMQFMLSC